MKTKHITTHSTEEAWRTAASIFPTDYSRDSLRSQNAGYDIYHSTADGVSAWISDLGTRLEVNLPNGETVNVWIDEEGPKETEQAESTSAAEELPENWEERKETARRIQRLMYHYTCDYMDELAKKEKEDKAVEEMKNSSSAEIKCVVLTAEWNAKVVLDCMKDCRKAVRILANKNEEVDNWMLAGINAAITEATKDGFIPFDLPACLCGMLGAEWRNCEKNEEDKKQ